MKFFHDIKPQFSNQLNEEFKNKILHQFVELNTQLQNFRMNIMDVASLNDFIN